MNWFQEHAYIATWCSLVIALVALLLRAPRNRQTGEVDWLGIILYVVLLSMVAAALTPEITKGSHFFPQTMVMFLIVVIIYKESAKAR